MTTAEAIEGITDAGRFERLATSVLRARYPDCQAVAHVGVNAAGKTVRNPVDGFCRVPNRQPRRYVTTQFATTEASRLEHKWLFDHRRAGKARKSKLADDGDLIKAARQAADIRQDDPQAEFVVYLCTNRVPELSLMQSVYRTADELSIEAVILERSQIQAYLDDKAEGQWLRQEYLGIAAVQPSRSLFRALSTTTLRSYSAEMVLGTAEHIVATRAAEEAFQAVQGQFATLHLLLGRSGAGKTVIARHALQRHIDAGGVGLWIPGPVAERAASLANAIEETLRSVHPGIGSSAGHAALELATAADPLLLVVDDINRCGVASSVLTKIAGWCGLRESARGERSKEERSVQLVCPIWDSHWAPVRNRLEGSGWLRVQNIGPLQRPEAIACLEASLRGVEGWLSRDQLSDLAGRMHDDPILLGLFAQLFAKDPDLSPNMLAEDVMGRFVESMMSELAERGRGSTAEYDSVLRYVGSEMVRRRSLYPRWDELAAWFPTASPAVDALSRLCTQGHVCRCVGRDGSAQFEFRHDRILEYFLSRAAADMLQAGDPVDRQRVLDPFFISYVGRAIAQLQNPDAVLEYVAREAPVALIAAAPYVSRTGATSVLARAHAWLMDAEVVLPSIQRDAFNLLANTQSPCVLDITHGVVEHQRILEARLRNGDVVAGAKALSIDFFPRARYSWLESLVLEAACLHRDKMIADLGTLLAAHDVDKKLRYGALCLCGYIGTPLLAPSLRSACEKEPDRAELLVAFLWAGLRCAGESPADLLDLMIPELLKLSAEGPQQQPTDRGRAIQDLAFAAWHGIPAPAISYLAGLGRDREEYKWVVAGLLEKTDHPLAIAYVVPLFAQAKHRAEQAGKIFFLADMWADQWRTRGGEVDARLSSASLEELRHLWSGNSNQDCLRNYAFSTWARYIDRLADHRSALVDAPASDAAVWARALRGDLATVSEVAAKLVEKPAWLRVVPNIWCADLKPGVELLFGKLGSDDSSKALRAHLNENLADVLRDIPVEDASGLLSRHWTSLRARPRFIQAALYIGTETTKALAAEAIEAVAPGREVFRYIEFFFGFRMAGLSEKLSMRHLDSLRPYLDRLDESCLGEMINLCSQHDSWSWAVEHLRPECVRRLETGEIVKIPDRDRFEHTMRHWFPTEQDMERELNAFELDPRQLEGRLSFWIERLAERRISHSRTFEVLKRWLGAAPTLRRYKIAAIIISAQGTRQELDILRLGSLGREYAFILADVEYAVRRRSLS